ncbi:hypothetical protein PUNSTDRAFT_54142 [Punctularia strigosozonata HHB-11173 SS5]|uniref:uncharacterized protein n=1 Tax=Punctularia strigosozonata (strain HHB-11173) TaxID=741275 RepID=UPI0004416544|nr:uncharacterized protein PUNSTDRAFT_54142 [Punctularia strigosozonata HHB-11173 SS5]EIN06746.1 hypothetical protein PUNSTDRAFT_54142 [Punctularia strigosozonata HHB-11173 SS5]
MSYHQRPASPNGSIVIIPEQRIRRSRDYYLDGADLVVLVQQILFRVHSYFFERESIYFKHRLSCPTSPGQDREGSSDTNPVILDDVSSEDFGRFVSVFYNPKYTLYDHMTVPEWTSVLRLAHYWQFREVKALSVRELQTHTIAPVEKISIYQTYNVDIQLLLPAFIALAVRPEPLAVDEGRQLGWETAMSLAKARELVRALPSTKPKSGNNANKEGAKEYETNEAEVQKIVEREVMTTVTPPKPALHINGSFAGASKQNTPLTAHVRSTSNPFSQSFQPSSAPSTETNGEANGDAASKAADSGKDVNVNGKGGAANGTGSISGRPNTGANANGNRRQGSQSNFQSFASAGSK